MVREIFFDYIITLQFDQSKGWVESYYWNNQKYVFPISVNEVMLEGYLLYINDLNTSLKYETRFAKIYKDKSACYHINIQSD